MFPERTKSLEQVQKEHIHAVLIKCHWNLDRARKLLGISRATLYRKVSMYNLKENTPND